MTNAVNIAQTGTISSSWRNRIINGGMTISQGAAGATITPAVTSAYATNYPVDRFQVIVGAASKLTTAQSSVAPTGFSFSTLITSASAYTVGAGEVFVIRQNIEGFNTADLAWGTASAQTVTLTFWVRSSLTGTFGGSLQNSASNRSYPFTYTINSANTWEFETITIPGDTTGTWVGATNGIGIRVNFGLGVGATFSGTAGAWAGSDFDSATGATSVVATNGATFYVAGVQLEEGSAASPFEYRDYGTELALCQRYFYICGLFNFGTNAYYQGYYGGSNAVWNIRYPVQMRATPVATINQPTQVQYYSQSGVWTNTTITLSSYNSGGPNYNTGTTDITVQVASDSTGGGKLLYLVGGATTTLPTISVNAEL
jgi:hypothetical protein